MVAGIGSLTRRGSAWDGWTLILGVSSRDADPRPAFPVTVLVAAITPGGGVSGHEVQAATGGEVHHGAALTNPQRPDPDLDTIGVGTRGHHQAGSAYLHATHDQFTGHERGVISDS